MQKSGIHWEDGYTQATCGFIKDPQWKKECEEHFFNKKKEEPEGGDSDSGGGVVEWGGWSHNVDENRGVCDRAVADCSKDKYGKFRAYADLGGRCRDATQSCNHFLLNRHRHSKRKNQKKEEAGGDKHWEAWLPYLRQTGNNCGKAMWDCIKYRFDRFAPYVERGGRCRDAVSLCESVLQESLLAGQSSGALSSPPEEGQNDLRLAFGGRNGNNNPMNNPFRADEIDKRNAKALSSHVREYLVNHLRLLRSSYYDGSESMKKIDSSLQHPEKCNWGRLNGPITRRGSAGVQYAEKWSLRMLRDFRKMADASFECALYTLCMLFQRDGVWSVDVHPFDNPAIEYNHGTLRQWIVECRNRNSRMLVVHVVVDVQNSNEYWAHNTAVAIDLEGKTACAFDPNGASGMHGYTVATTAGAPFTQITLHDLYAKHGIGKTLFADIPGLKWIPQYKGTV